MSTYLIQPSSRTDFITSDGEELTQLPYPFHVNADGDVLNLPGYKRVLGFAKDLSKEQVDIWFPDSVRDIQKIVGTYIVTEDNYGDLAVHLTAVQNVRELGDVNANG